MRYQYLSILVPVLYTLSLSGCPTTEDPNPNPNPANPNFATSLYFPAGGDPFSVRTADLNGDGRRDIVVANNVDNSISVILGDADTTYAYHVDYPAGTTPVSLHVGDVTGDARADVVCVNSGSGDLSYFKGKGDGTFEDAVRLGLLATAAPLDVTAADVDEDGDLDLITADSGTNTISILKNLAGTFSTIPEILPVGTFPRAILAADLNKDNKVDLIATNRNSNNVTVLLNTGLGVFGVPVIVPAGTNPRMTRAVDVDKDTDLDLLVTNPNSKNISILLNNGLAVFTPGTTIVLDQLPSRFDVGDFDTDGNLDLAVVLFSAADNNPPLGMAEILFGNGTGGFPESQRYGTGGAAQDLVVADLDADGRLDLLTADSQRDAASIVYGRGGGEFAGDVRVPVNGQPRELAAVDLDADSDLDLVVITQQNTAVLTLKNNGSGGFTLGNSVTLAGTPRGLAVGNINTADSVPDVAVTQLAGSNGVRVLFGKGDGTLLTTGGTVPLPGRDPRSVAIGDLNKDGKPDLVTGDSNQDELSIALGDGVGGFATPTRADSGNFPLGVGLTDANGDGNLDAVYISRNDPDSVTDQALPRAVRMLGKGDGTFVPDSDLRVETGSNPLDIVLGDITGDGRADAVVASAGANAAFTHIIRADGAILPGTSRRAGVGARAIALARVGAGANLDIITVNSDNTFSLIQNSGSNAFTFIATYHAGSDAIEGVAGDFDKDGSVDLALANRGTNDLSIVFGAN